MLTGLELVVKPLADVIADYTRCDGQCKRDYKVHKTHLLPLIDRGRKADKYSITENSTHYNAEAPHPVKDEALLRIFGNIRGWR